MLSYLYFRQLQSNVTLVMNILGKKKRTNSHQLNGAAMPFLSSIMQLFMNNKRKEATLVICTSKVASFLFCSVNYEISFQVSNNKLHVLREQGKGPEGKREFVRGKV